MDSVNLGVLLLIGIGVFGGLIGAWVFQKLRIPQVVGYIFIGILIGQSGLHVVKASDISALQSFNWFALGIIGFLVGGELKGENFKKYGKQFMYILFGEGMTAFLLVNAAVTLIVYYICHNWATAFAAGVVFGAIASATDPASTVEVLWEYRSRGPLTTALIAIVALDDALAMTLYGIGTSFAQMLTGGRADIGAEVLLICKDLFGSIFLGIAAGFILEFTFKLLRQQKERMLALAVGMLLVVIGFANIMDMDVIIVTMTMGIVLINFAPKRSQELFTLMRSFSIPIYVMFFVLVGARLGVSQMPLWLWGIVAAYVIGRSFGKITGAYFGAKWSKADMSVQNYTGLGLFCQGGVAIGLSIMASQHLGNIQITPAMTLGDTIIFGVTATTLIVQVLGPPLVKKSIQLGNEIGRNVTMDDVIDSLKVADVTDTEIVPVEENKKIRGVFELFSSLHYTAYPVVDSGKRVVGMITLTNLKEILTDPSCWEWMVAGDALAPVVKEIPLSMPLRSALDIMEEFGLDETPVVDSTENPILAGVLDKVTMQKRLHQELIKRQSHIEDKKA